MSRSTRSTRPTRPTGPTEPARPLMSASTKTLVATMAGFSAAGFALLAFLYWAFIANPPFSFAGIDLPLKVLVIAAIISFSIFILAAPEKVGAAAGRRSNRLTANALVASLVALGIVFAL